MQATSHPATLTAVLTAEIIKPISCTWDEIGPHMRDLRSVMHRCLNDAMTAMAANDRAPKEAQVHPRTLAYREVNASLERTREWASKAVRKHGASEASKSLARLTTIDMPGGNASAAADLAHTRYQEWRKTSWKGETSLPSFVAGSPIFVRGDHWSIGSDERGAFVDVKLHAGRAPRVRFALGVDGGSAHATLRRLLTGEASPGDMKIVWIERKKKWIAKITYSFAKPQPLVMRGDVAVAIHRGIRVAWTLCDSAGKGHVVDDGREVLHAKQAFANRRSALGAHRKMLGDGARGHGQTRRMEHIKRLDDAEARYVRTRCQQWAAALVKYAARVGAGTVVIEDYSARDMADNAPEDMARLIRRWPFAALAECVRWACAKSGLALVEVPAAYQSVACPQCGHIDASNDSGRGVFECTSCALKRSVDHIAAWNMLRSAGFGGFREAKARADRFIEAAKGAA